MSKCYQLNMNVNIINGIMYDKIYSPFNFIIHHLLKFLNHHIMCIIDHEEDNPMTTLSIYTDKYDSNENIVNNGLSGKAFLDIDNQFGNSFTDLDEALDYCLTNNIEVHRIEFNYLSKDGIQMFTKFKIEP